MERREFDHLEAQADAFKKQREEAEKEMETLNPIKKIKGFVKKREAAKGENYYNKTKEIELGYVQDRAERINTFLDWFGANQEKYENWIKNSFGGNEGFEKSISQIRIMPDGKIDPDEIKEGTTYVDHLDFLKKNMEKLDAWVHRNLSGWDNFYRMVENDEYIKLPEEPTEGDRRHRYKHDHKYTDPGDRHRNNNYPHGTY